MMDVTEIRKSFPVYQKDPNLIFFDSAASSLKVQDAIDRVQYYNSELGVNAHRGAYALAYETTKLYEESRQALASFINAREDEIIFTRGTTASLNMLASAFMDRIQPGDEIITTPYSWPQSVDERQGKLLRQRRRRDVLQDHQIGADLAGRLADPRSGRKRRRQIHRRVL